MNVTNRPVFYLKHRCVPHRKHIAFTLQDQQVNAVYRFVTVEEDEVGGTCGTNGREEERV
jgi:hypothetical protein